MESVVLVVHLILALSIIAVVLIQPSEGGGLGGMGGGSGGFGGLTTARGAANILTRLTAIFVVGFIITSLTLAVLAGKSRSNTSILDAIPAEEVVEGAADNVDEIVDDAIKAVEEKAAQEPEIPVSQ